MGWALGVALVTGRRVYVNCRPLRSVTVSEASCALNGLGGFDFSDPHLALS